MGRFLQTDPMGYQDSLNLYQAFNMNPVNFTDPLGLDTDAGRIASSLSKYYESIRPKNPGPTWFDRLLGKIAVTGFQVIRDVDNMDMGNFTLQSLYDTGNLLTLGNLERTAAQKDLDIGDRVWFFLNEMPERIQNAGTFGLLDNLAAERGNGLEGAGRAVYKTLFDLSPASDIYTIFHTDAGIEEKIRAGGLFTSKIASLGLIFRMLNVQNSVKFTYDVESMPNSMNLGATMPEGELFNFTRWKTDHVVLSETDILYRGHSIGRAGGPWWTRVKPVSEIQMRIDAAVLPKWNTFEEISTLSIPKGFYLQGWEGTASYQKSFYIGGMNQIYIPYVPKQWITTKKFIK
jgi:hypothetical protein